MTRKLIIAPHVDDEVLGCGGIIDDNTFIIHCGLSDNQKHGNKYFTREQRLLEFEKIKKATGCKSRLLKGNHVNRFSAPNMISDIEKEINAFLPDVVFIPTPSYNQDHKEVYKASIIALRPHDINYFVPKILMYEQPQDLWYGDDSQFSPNVFIEIDIEKKIMLYKCLESQVRNHRGTDVIASIAAIRGSQSNCKHAEAFKSIRWKIKEKFYKDI